jgi:predicted tellurium resistance membrane protein TerC
MISINWTTAKEVFGILLVFTGLFDAFKYSLQAFKIQKAQNAKIQSRKFVLMAIGNDLVKTVYSILILDIYIFLSSILALFCMLHLWYVVYLFYPYKYRGLAHFKRPNLLIFTINAMIPNHLRKHL